jgi:N-glycosidase YbiA
MTEDVRFYGVKEPFGQLSNFAPFPVEIDGRVWPTAEHYFQAQKFVGTKHEEEIRRAKSPMVAARMGRAASRPLRNDWEDVKDAVMRKAVRAKFAQHASLRSLLVSTGSARIVEHSANDRYWADGGDGTGLNRLGAILMNVQDKLRAMRMTPEQRSEVWSQLLNEPGESWVAFEFGTCVVLVEPQADLGLQARRILEEWGPVHAGSPAGDFSVTRPLRAPGWVVTCHHRDVLTYVAPEDVEPGATDVVVGLAGRRFRDLDARALRIVHVHDARAR